MTRKILLTLVVLACFASNYAQVKVYSDYEFEGARISLSTLRNDKPDQVLTTDEKGTLVLKALPSADLQKQIDELRSELRAMRELLSQKQATDVAQPQLQLSPNPSNGIFHFEYKQNVPEKMTVFDSKGTEVYSAAATTGNNTLDLRHLSKGQYFVRIESGGKALDTKSIILE